MFTVPFNQLRAQQNRWIKDPFLYPKLPESLIQDPEWRHRSFDLAIIRHLLAEKTALRILDIGAWNGWLSHRLAEMGHTVTAVDYFTDPHDGLGARRFYPTAWDAIQMNLEDLSCLEQRFDVIILNRCVQFFLDPPGYAAQARVKLAPSGVMLLTGLAFFRDPHQKIQGVKNLRAYLNAHGFDFFKEIKGYLDENDQQKMQNMGIRLSPYPQLRLANLKSLITPTAPRHYYGVWR
jgi:2-polyprenyl-3-methyl-5-hydroxy-6-metoxy-1,4-benzoquinol methylase